MKKLILFLIIFINLFSIELKSQTNVFEDSSSINVFLNQIVITGQLFEKKLNDVVHDITVFDSSFISTTNANTLEEILSYKPSLKIIQDNVLGSGLSMQGLSGENVKILLDGIPIVGRLDGIIDLNQINLNNIDRIEIIEGPLSVEYGTDALAGTVNLISKSITGNSILIKTDYESIGKYNFFSSYTNKFNKYNYLISLSRNYFDGWSDSENFTIIPKKNLADSNRFKQWKPKEQYQFNTKINRSWENISVKISSNHFIENITNRGLPRKPYSINAFDDYYKTYRNNISSHLSFNDRLKSIISFNSYKRKKNNYFIDLTTLESTLTDDINQTNTKHFLYTNKTDYLYKLNHKSDIQIGYDLNYENTQGNRIQEDSKNQGDYALFNNNEFLINRNLKLRTGVRYSYNTSYKSPITPSVHIKYNLGKFNLKGSWSKGFRSPSLKELYLEFVDINHNIIGNEFLIPEKSNNLQFSIDFNNQNKNYTIDFNNRLFYNNVKNLITLADIGSNYTYLNIGKFSSLGNLSSINIITKFLHLTNEFSLIGGSNNIEEDKIYEKYNYTKKYNLNLIIKLPNNNTSLSIFYQYSGKENSFSLTDEGDIINSQIDSYQIMNINKSLKVSKNINIIAGCKNIFNITDIKTNGINNNTHSSNSRLLIGTGRTYFLTIKYNI